MDHQIRRILENSKKIESASHESLGLVFGAAKHKFRLNPVIQLQQIIDFENKYKFEIPAGYREFMLQVGDGGAGPFYGLKQRFVSIGATVRHEEAQRFNLPSVYTKTCSESPSWKQELFGDDFEVLEENDFLYSQGNMELFDVGCGSAGVLVLNGPMAGAVCITDYGFSPFVFPEKALFLDLYEMWQEAVLENRKGTIFGF